MDVYREIILEHYKHPLHRGKVGRADYSADAINPSCGDVLHVEFQLAADGTIEDVKFSGQGCAISQASADLMAEKIIGKTKEELAQLTSSDVYEMLGGPVNPGREKCATLVLRAMKQ